ncbi:MAG: 2Fe-2S iron-sulfur cluster-binding protein [Myxococcota bacterium]
MPRLTLVPMPGHPSLRDVGPSPHVLDVARGTRVLDAASEHGFLISTRCGGVADCLTCQVYLLDDGHAASGLSPPAADEFAALQSMKASLRTRLACQALVLDDVTVLVPDPRSVEDL